MAKHTHKQIYSRPEHKKSIIRELWHSFWNGPEFKCPKCGGDKIVYYDPFFFAPLRTLNNKRRIKCTDCRFIWRPSRSQRSFWERFRDSL